MKASTCADLKTTGAHGPWKANSGRNGERCGACGLLRYTSTVEGQPPTYESFAPAPATPLEPASGVRLRDAVDGS